VCVSPVTSGGEGEEAGRPPGPDPMAIKGSIFSLAISSN
jgi:hypothetical protein